MSGPFSTANNVSKFISVAALLLFCAAPTFASISFTTSAIGSGTNGTSLTITISTTNGDCVSASATITPTTTTISSVTDGAAGNSFTKFNAINNGTTLRSELWGRVMTSNQTSIIINTSGTITTLNAVIGDYTPSGGTCGLGVNTTNTGATNNPTITLSGMGSSSSWSVSSLSDNSTNQSLTAQTGNLRNQSGTGHTTNTGLVDNTGATSETMSATTSASHTWAAVAGEFTFTASGGTFEDDSWKMLTPFSSDVTVSVWGLMLGAAFAAFLEKQNVRCKTIFSLHVLNRDRVMAWIIPVAKTPPAYRAWLSPVMDARSEILGAPKEPRTISGRNSSPSS